MSTEAASTFSISDIPTLEDYLKVFIGLDIVAVGTIKRFKPYSRDKSLSLEESKAVRQKCFGFCTVENHEDVFLHIEGGRTVYYNYDKEVPGEIHIPELGGLSFSPKVGDKVYLCDITPAPNDPTKLRSSVWVIADNERYVGMLQRCVNNYLESQKTD